MKFIDFVRNVIKRRTKVVFKKISEDKPKSAPQPEPAEEVVVTSPLAGAVNVEITANLNRNARGVFKDEQSGSWKVAVLKFDADTGIAKVEKILDEGSDRGFATERFKILAIELDLV